MKFSDVLDIRNGRNQRQVENANGKYPIYGSGGVMGRATDFICDAGTVVIGRKGSINNPFFVDEPFWNVDTAFGLVAHRDVLLPKYLFYFCVNFDFEQLNTTVTIPSLTKANLLQIEINVPDMDEQRYVVRVLDKICRLTDLQEQELHNLDQLVKSRFIELFGDPELNPRGLPVLPWNAVFQTTTGKLDSNAMVENGRYPFFTCAKESYKIDSYAFDCEALLLAGNNAAGIYDVKHYKGKFNAYQRTYVLRLMNEKWSYILFKRQLEDKLRYLQSQSKGTNTRYLTLGILNELRFVVPSIAEQEQFAAFVEQTDKSKLAVQKGLQELEILKKSLMQQYFG